MKDWRWPIVVLVIGLGLVGAYVYSIQTARSSLDAVGETLQQAGEKAVQIAESFQSQQITETFTSAFPEIRTSERGRLQVATLEATETFTQSAETKLFWDWFSLGETVTEVRVPATYRYFVDLSEEWELTVTDQMCLVRAPALRPFLPVAIRTDRIERRTQAGWLDFQATQQMDRLESSLSDRLALTATDARRMELVRDQARRTVAEFVRAWLLENEQWREDGLNTISVTFAGEEPSDEALILPRMRPPEG